MQRAWTLFFLFLVVAAVFAQSGAPASAEARVPAYNPPPAKGAKLPPLLPADMLLGPDFQQPYQARAYQLAAKIPTVIYQLPCYCYCDRIGHKSLHSCYESTHAANCGSCLKELYFAYELTKKGQTPKQIRQRIERGEWKQVDLEATASLN